MSIAKDIAAEMKRRQDLVDARDADPTLADVWDGTTAQPDMDSHRYWLGSPDDCPCDDCNGVVLFV